MTKHLHQSWTVLIAAGLFAACTSAGGTSDGTTTAGPAQVPAGGSAGGGAVATATPSATATSTTASAAMPSQTNTAAANAPTTAPAAAPANTAAPGAQAAPAATPGASETVAPAAGPASTCTERTVSYSKPCHNDPDPCGLKSGWPGDEYCLLPPKEGEGIQIHIGPKDFKSMTEVMKYKILAGEEFNNSVAAHIPLAENKFFQRMTVQMRPGSHHWISTVIPGKIDEKFYDDTGCSASGAGTLGGGQNLIYDDPPGGIPAPENAGLGRELQGNSSLCINLHSYNFTDKEQMREIWINIYFIDEAKVTQRTSPIAMVGGLGINIAPKTTQDLTYTANFPGDGRIIQMYGHRHAWTPRFAVWLRGDLIYDSHSWQDSVTYNYDSISKNPPIMTEKKVDGAVSGVVEYKAGDELKFTCFIENNGDETLGFSNEVYGGEMCNLWGSTVGSAIVGTYF